MAITLDGTTGVTAAEFDGTVDASNLTGTLPAIDGSALTGIDTAPPTTYGAVGTYALLYLSQQGSRTPEYTSSGAYLYPSNTFTDGAQAGYYTGSGTVSGTWRLMGALGYYSGGTSINRADFSISVWVRIS